MRIPAIHGLIERRILVDYSVNLETLAGLLPAPFRPRNVDGHGVAGVCLIRLAGVRPAWTPSVLGIRSENAAYRAAVEWDSPDGMQQGVFVWRRVTSSRLNAWAGGRLFPGVHDLRRFDVRETATTYELKIADANDVPELAIRAQLDPQFLPQAFDSPAAAERLICQDTVGYSPAKTCGSYDGLELEMENSTFQELEVESLTSTFFDDRTRFPQGTIQLAHAILMQDVRHLWKSQPTLHGANVPAACAAICAARTLQPADTFLAAATAAND